MTCFWRWRSARAAEADRSAEGSPIDAAGSIDARSGRESRASVAPAPNGGSSSDGKSIGTRARRSSRRRGRGWRSDWATARRPSGGWSAWRCSPRSSRPSRALPRQPGRPAALTEFPPSDLRSWSTDTWRGARATSNRTPGPALRMAPAPGRQRVGAASRAARAAWVPAPAASPVGC